MDPRIATAESLLTSGKASEAVDLLTDILSQDPDAPVQTWRAFAVQLYRLQRYREAEAWGQRALERHPKDFDLWNLRGVVLRRLARYDEALAALEKAQRLNPRSAIPLVNMGNIHNDRRDGLRAEAAFAKLVRHEPRNAEYHRGLGQSLMHQKRFDAAMPRLRQAIALKKDYVDAWLDLSGCETARHRHAAGLSMLDKALLSAPDHPKLLEAKVQIMRRSGDLRLGAEFLESLMPRLGEQAWVHFQYGACVCEADREKGNIHYLRATELSPTDEVYAMALAESYDRSRYGDEGQHIQAAYEALMRAMALGPIHKNHRKIAQEILVRVGEYAAADAIGDFRQLGRDWATTGRHTALLKQLARVRSPEDRQELIHQHRLWGDEAEAEARRTPIRKPAGPRPGGKIRLGYMSSDLRGHPVAYFTLPLFEHVDRDRFEIYCYSFYQGNTADPIQQHLTSLVDQFRWWPDRDDRSVAQGIADDQLDMLIELGGSTHMNKLAVMAYKPAPLSASWLGYPHSSGLSTIDHLIVDPYLKPPSSDLLIEQPLEMPSTWIAMGRLAFPDRHRIDPAPPVERNGFITYGTANNPYKYGPEMLRIWARTVRETPGSRFIFIRPEGGAETFRTNMRAAFAGEGVAADRVLFNAVRGAHMQFYNDLDISLDTFPQTGGTTTCESLWMGVPTVSLVGEALFERLSYSILVNAGLPELVARTPEAFVEIAVRLAGDPGRIAELRVNLRERLKASPLGQTERFATDFYAMIERAVRERNGAA